MNRNDFTKLVFHWLKIEILEEISLIRNGDITYEVLQRVSPDVLSDDSLFRLIWNDRLKSLDAHSLQA